MSRDRPGRATDTDVAIVGGGLAGLSLALQLRQACPGARVTVLERRPGAAPEAAFKVGESTVEIGAHYFADTLGMRDHLDAAQLRKFGFRFFFSDGVSDPQTCTELGVSRVLPTPSWQLDRGRFENELARRAVDAGVNLRAGCRVRRVVLGADGASHQVGIDAGDGETTLSARWLVDASGRAGLLRRKLDLTTDNGHDANAVWWRVDGRLDPNAWSADPAWRARCTPPDRWRSTNHLCGPGYWVWMIPLASGAHSLGIVCDASMHPIEAMNTHDKAMAWLRIHQPRLAGSLDAPGHALRDFGFLRGFSHGCKQVFSADRWALTGEAGPFLDPFYSPGSDFIAMANTCVASLVARDLGGGTIEAHAALLDRLFLSFHEAMLPIYRGQYALFGDAQVLPVKVIWDYTFYWAMLAPLAFGARLTDVALLGRVSPMLQRGSELNRSVQALLQAWGRANGGGAGGAGDPRPGRYLDQHAIGWFREMNRALVDRLDNDAFVARMAVDAARMEALAAEIAVHARATHPRLDVDMPVEGRAEAGPLLDPHWYAAA